MYVFTLLATDTIGRDTATCDWQGTAYSTTTRHGACMALARRLCGAGAPDGPWVGVDPQTGVERLHGPSLHRLAGLTIEETGQTGPRLARWKAFPGREHPEDDA
jgi:hypothetical protein